MPSEGAEIPSPVQSKAPEGNPQPTQRQSLLGRLIEALNRVVGPTIGQARTGEVRRLLTPFSPPLPTEKPPSEVREPSKP